MVNAVTPDFVKTHSLDAGPLNDLIDSNLNMNSFGRLSAQPLGYVIIRVQVEGVQGYNKDQVVLVIPDPTDFGSQVPVISGTPTTNQIINVIKDSKIDELSLNR